MKNRIKRFLCTFLSFVLLVSSSFVVNAKEEANLSISAPSAILMEASTGTIVYAKDAEKELPMASVTKVMTLLLVFEAIDSHQLKLNQEISISDHAASMGGSQVFLEPGETQSVETLIKCISIASANDAAVAMAEAVSGTEEQFVAEMNQKAKDLHMKHTHFVNCCGLDADNHYSCAKDLALVSRELIINHPEIFDYCTIWQEDITHTTKKGSKPFTLTNTNKLLKQYPYATGLKTGSTSIAKFCLSASATKDDMTFIAVIMAAPTPKDRFKDATTLLNYGFCNTSIYKDVLSGKKYNIPIKKGTMQNLIAMPKEDFSYLTLDSEVPKDIKRVERIPKSIVAPVKKNQKVGVIEYYNGDKKIGSIPVIATHRISKASYSYLLKELLYYTTHFQSRSGK